MPIPKPKKGEKQTEFIGRCMGNPIMVKEYKDSKQRSAICYSQWRGKSNMHINSMITNIQSRSEQFMGRDHVIVPVIMVVEGVHDGSAGPMFYPSEEIKATAGQWDGKPVTVRHPKDKDDNFIIAANAPESIIGHISQPIWDDKLRAEAWIDVEKANNISVDIMTIIHGNGQLEVSTGLFSTDETVKGDWKGEAYNAIIRDIIPDHLALLPGEKGACSWIDGCGIRANKGGEIAFKGSDLWQQIQGRMDAKGGNIRRNHITNIFDSFFLYSQKEKQSSQEFKQNYSRTATGIVDFIGDEIKVNKEGGENMKFKGYDFGNDDLTNIPVPVLKAFFNNQAGEANEWAGKFKTNELSHSDIHNQVQNLINSKDTQNEWNFVRDIFDKFFIYSKEKENQPIQIFKQSYNLTASEAVEFTGDEVEVVQKTEYILKNNKKFNRREDKMADKDKCCPEKVKALIANEKSNYVEEDTEWLETMEEAQLDKMIANVGISEDAKKTLVTAAVEEAFDKAVQSGEMIKVEKKDPDKKETPPTAEEYIANAPGEIQDVLRTSLNMHKEKKAALVQQIVANEQNRFTKEQLDAKEVGELENIAALIPLKAVDESGQQVSYAANSGANVNTNKEEPLEMPTMETKK